MEVIYIWTMMVVDLKVSLQCMYFELTHLYSRGMQMANGNKPELQAHGNYCTYRMYYNVQKN